MKRIYSVCCVLLFCLTTFAQASHGRISGIEYVKKYKDLAISEMERVGIPASITIAQGILESDNGNSTLARKGNNHFGIKCHNSWKGKKVYHDDDRRKECFRSYKSVYDSYIDHSEFLSGKSRYASLFDLKTTDYKRWAHGLKKAGYATDPNYARRLIKIIEENKLYTLDREGDWSIPSDTHWAEKGVDDFVITPFNTHVEKYNNGVKYITVEDGDSFESIAEEFGLRQWELYHYNDIPEDSEICEARNLYIEPKRGKAHKNHEFHIVKEGESLQKISHKYGVKLKKILRYNDLKEGDVVETGIRLNLRRRKK